ncbi:GH23165, partial [Drosophila grimshawi]
RPKDADAGIGAGYGEVAPTSELDITKDGVTEAKAIELKSISRRANSANGGQATGRLVSDFMNSVERDGVITVKAPAFSDNRKSTLIDMGIVPVGIVFDDDANLNIEEFELKGAMPKHLTDLDEAAAPNTPAIAG